MSKPVKELVRSELVKRFQGIDSLAVVGFTGLDAITTHTVRGRLLDKGVRMMVVKNSVARQAFKALGIERAGDMLDGPCAVAYGADSKVSVVNVVRSLLEIAKDAPKLTVKAALLEGEIFGKDRIEELSKFPTRDESLSQLAGLLLAPGRKLAACLIGPGSKVASILKTIEDKRKEEAEAAPKAEAPAPESRPTVVAGPQAAAPAAEAAAPAPEAKA
jgi:large subunit ribosomal protein L10